MMTLVPTLTIIFLYIVAVEPIELHIKKLKNGEVLCQFKVKTEQKQPIDNYLHRNAEREYVPIKFYWKIDKHYGLIKYQRNLYTISNKNATKCQLETEHIQFVFSQQQQPLMKQRSKSRAVVATVRCDQVEKMVKIGSVTIKKSNADESKCMATAEVEHHTLMGHVFVQDGYLYYNVESHEEKNGEVEKIGEKPNVEGIEEVQAVAGTAEHGHKETNMKSIVDHDHEGTQQKEGEHGVSQSVDDPHDNKNKSLIPKLPLPPGSPLETTQLENHVELKKESKQSRHYDLLHRIKLERVGCAQSALKEFCGPMEQYSFAKLPQVHIVNEPAVPEAMHGNV